MRLSHIYIYPVKSLGGISVPEVAVGERGPVHDRRWMIVDAEGTFVSQRKYARMALLQCALEDRDILVREKGKAEVVLRLPAELRRGDEVRVKIWKNQVRSLLGPAEANDWISAYLGFPCRFVYMPDRSHRIIDPKYVPEIELVSFADGFPYLLIGQASLDDLNTRLETPVPMDRFRPNLVVTGAQPNEELSWAELRIGGADFAGRKACVRCTMTTVDQETGVKGQEPLHTLSQYMLRDGGVVFGENLTAMGEGKMIRVGDAVQVARWK